MSAPTFTPGPWRNGDYTAWAGDHLIAECAAWESHKNGPLPAKQRRANSRLIAAAPELYAALEALLSHHGNCTNPTCRVQRCADVAAARAALAKARGEE